MKATRYKCNATQITTQPTTIKEQELALNGLLPRMVRKQHTRPLYYVTTERKKLQRADSNSKLAQVNAPLALKRLRVGK
jgi:hypothetical protein